MKIDYRKEGWDKFTFRASSNGLLMVNASGKSNFQKLEETKTSLEENKFKYSETKNKDTKTAINLFEKMVKQEYDIKKLEPIKDVPHLSESCKTHLCDIYTRTVFDRTEDIKSKYLEKGLLLEEDAITQYSLMTKNFYKKNEEEKKNEYVQGTTDFYDDENVIDTKVNWSIFQFIRTVAKGFNQKYMWQLYTYMWLWNKKKGILVYVLLDTPKHMIKAEQDKLKYDFVGTADDYEEACKEIERLHTYTDISINDKSRIYELERSDDAIEQLRLRIIECRKYLNNFGNYTDTELE